MAIDTSLTYFLSQQAADTTAVPFRPSVDVPQEIEIKVPRPAIKTLDSEEDTTAQVQQEATTSQDTQNMPARETVSEPPVAEKQDPVVDTIDFKLIHNWKQSAFSKELWPPESNDSISQIPVNYFSKDHLAPEQNKMSIEQEEEDITTSDKEEAADTLVAGEQTVDKIEEINISDPTLVSEKDVEQPLLQQDWFLIVMVVLVALTGLVRLKWNKYLSDVFSAVAFSNVASKIQETTTGSKKMASFWLGFLFYSNFSLLLFERMQVTQRGLFDLSGWRLLLTLFGFLVVIFTLKKVVYHFVGWVFRVLKPTTEYLYQSSVMSKAFGIMLLPLVVIFPFLEPEAQNWVPKIGLTLFILLYVMQIGRGIGANLRNTLSGYYIILYLCALEILPLSILYKVLFY